MNNIVCINNDSSYDVVLVYGSRSIILDINKIEYIS